MNYQINGIAKRFVSILFLLSFLLITSCSQGDTSVSTGDESSENLSSNSFELDGYTYNGVTNEEELVASLALEKNGSGDWVSTLNGQEVPYTGILTNSYGTWYVENGEVALSKSGTYSDYQGKKWNNVDGKVLTESDNATTKTTTMSTTASFVSNRLVQADASKIDKHDAYILTGGGEYTVVNVRYGPSTNYDIVTKVEDLTGLIALTYDIDGWVMVETYEGKQGWVRGDFIVHHEMDGIAKPVLYLYPEKKTNVSVKLSLKDASFSCTYPDYGNGWNVIAYPNGRLINKADSKEYSYLYWELNSNVKFDLTKGFIVRGKDTATFLQKKLAQMGLQPKEYNEFIVYWLPRMQNNEYNLISFQTKAYTDKVKLNISPKPDSVLRVNMAYKALTSKEAKAQESLIKAQKFPKFERKGFTVVEWGGEVVLN